MVVNRLHLLHLLRVLSRFDASASPFVGVQIEGKSLGMHRSSSSGMMETISYRKDEKSIAVSLDHFKESLSAFSEDEVRIRVDAVGHLRIESVGAFDTSTYVHTLRTDACWGFTHSMGELAQADILAASLAGIYIPEALVLPPILKGNRLMFVTGGAVAVRNNVGIDAFPYMRETFLRLASALAPTLIHLTTYGYWTFTTEHFRVAIAGHKQGDVQYSLYPPAAPLMQQFVAGRLVFSLRQASARAQEGCPLSIDPKEGVVVRDVYNQLSRFALGASEGWSRFSVSKSTAATIASTLSQDADETVGMSLVGPSVYRLSRGNWEVTFRAAASP